MQKPFERVLLVDDDDTCNYLSQRIIETLELADEIVVLKNGKQALDFIITHCVTTNQLEKRSNFVLLDINMALLNGFELLEALHHTNYMEHLRIVILSTSQNEYDINEAAKYRINGYLTKPLNIKEFKKIINESLKSV